MVEVVAVVVVPQSSDGLAKRPLGAGKVVVVADNPARGESLASFGSSPDHL